MDTYAHINFISFLICSKSWRELARQLSFWPKYYFKANEWACKTGHFSYVHGTTQAYFQLIQIKMKFWRKLANKQKIYFFLQHIIWCTFLIRPYVLHSFIVQTYYRKVSPFDKCQKFLIMSRKVIFFIFVSIKIDIHFVIL